MDKLADKRSKHPGWQDIDSGLERDAEQEVSKVSNAQVQYEDVGGATRLARLVSW